MRNSATRMHASTCSVVNLNSATNIPETSRALVYCVTDRREYCGAQPQRIGCPSARLLTAFSLLVYTEQPLPTWLFLKKSRTSLNLTVQSRSENALVGVGFLNINNAAQQLLRASLGGIASPDRQSSFAIGVDRSDRPFRGFSPGRTTPRDLCQTTVIAKLLHVSSQPKVTSETITGDDSRKESRRPNPFRSAISC
jgi:hypothetical protein